jgi:EAL domain-containing protein (putative c-di-GMP-specific phosphodiesterase class I)
VDTIARLGGDEFAILLRGATGPRAAAVADRLIEAVRTHDFAIATEPVRVTASFGMAVASGGDETAETTLAAADLAMYHSKQTGRDRLVEFSPALRAAAEDRHTWADLIRRALEEDLFLLYQQPILDLSSGRISQHELLIRMEGDDGAMITPDEFLPVAERFNLVQEIDRWVVHQAIRLIADAEHAGRHLVLEVNLSGRSMGDVALFEMLERELRESGIDARKLVLEVTETAAIENMEEARAFAQRLSSLGCRLALDDFGSGFGSFYYLKHLPLDYLKIDGDFIRNLRTSKVDQAVVRSIVQIAESVGYQTIAEFVLDAETLDVVREFGVHFAQGYHVGVPEPVASLQVATRGR